MKKKYYAAYGSNLNIDQMLFRCPNATVEGIAVLRDWRLLFKGSKSGNYLTIEPCEGSYVPVGIWLITPEDERNLDFYEGFPTFYRKETLHTRLYSTAFDDQDRDIDAMVYVMDESRRCGIPSRSYFDICCEGYEDFGFDRKFLTDALKRSTRMEVKV